MRGERALRLGKREDSPLRGNDCSALIPGMPQARDAQLCHAGLGPADAATPGGKPPDGATSGWTAQSAECPSPIYPFRSGNGRRPSHLVPAGILLPSAGTSPMDATWRLFPRGFPVIQRLLTLPCAVIPAASVRLSPRKVCRCPSCSPASRRRWPPPTALASGRCWRSCR